MAYTSSREDRSDCSASLVDVLLLSRRLTVLQAQAASRARKSRRWSSRQALPASPSTRSLAVGPVVGVTAAGGRVQEGRRPHGGRSAHGRDQVAAPCAGKVGQGERLVTV
eukprot:762638-Hanusia_phi.AAC.1